MGKATGFLDYNRVDAGHRSPQERLRDWNEFIVPLDPEKQREQASRCMNCGVPFCHAGVLWGRAVSGCPNNNLIPEWNEMLYRGLYREAWDRLVRTNLLPEFTSRVCPSPCEGACTNGLNGEPVCIKQNERLIVETAFENGWVKESGARRCERSESVAVVGSGPSGLSCAMRLNMLGFHVTVFERSDRAGGLLMYGIPNMKLDKSTVERRIKLMEDLGITFKYGVNVGKDVTIDELKKDFDAVAICAGASAPRDLKIPGREYKNIRFAVDYLAETTKQLLEDGPDSLSGTLEGKNVIVIGGGDTGNDCVGTSLRRGARSVTQFEIMPEPPSERQENNPWPQWPAVKKTDYGQEEAIYLQGEDPRIYLINSVRFTGDENGVTGIDTVKVTWEQKNGRFVPVPVPGSEQHYDADLVLLAMGFVGAEDYSVGGLEMPDPMGGDYTTSDEKVFVAGDVRRGQSLVIWGIREGRECADAIEAAIG